ncbi:MAG: hypothetical protein N2595_00975 [bacterium]|nr:hypothetical protein [bacterium]
MPTNRGTLRLSRNTAGLDGGAIFLTGPAQVDLPNPFLENNIASKFGGTIFAQEDADLTIAGDFQ